MSKILLEEPVVSLRGYENDPSNVDLRKITRKAVEAEREERRRAEVAEKVKKFEPLLQAVRKERDTENALTMLFDELVPPQGAASTIAGELVRAIMRLLYRDYNDGDKFFTGYGLETCAPSAAYLMDHGFEQEIEDVLDNQFEYQSDSAYTLKLREIARAVITKILTEPELLITPSDADSRGYDAESISSREWRDSVTIDYPWQVEQLIEDGVISTRDVEDYIFSCLEYDPECEGFDIGWVGSSDLEVQELTSDGQARVLELVERGHLWDDFLAEYEDQLNDDDEDDDEEFDEGLTFDELNESAALAGIATAAASGIIVDVVKRIIDKVGARKKKSKWIDYKNYVIERTPEGKINIWDIEGNQVEGDLHTIKAAKAKIKTLPKPKLKPPKKKEDKLEESADARGYTDRLVELAETFGVSGWALDLICDLVSYMSEDEVKDFAISNGYLDESEELDESVSKKLTEDVASEGEAPLGPQMGQDSGIAAMLNDLIRDEWEAIQGYNDMQNMVRAEQPGYADEFLRVIADINAEENVHVGQLQKLMEIVAPNAKEFNSGEKEAEEQIHEAAAAETENNRGISNEV